MTSIAQTYEAAVLGGGLAGAAAATRLAQQGVTTVLIEKKSQPHHKVCGEFISYEAQNYLTQLGVDIEKLGAVPIDKLQLMHGAKSLAIPLGFRAASLSRYRLDAAVLAQAKARGVHMRSGTTVTGMEKNDLHWRINCDNGSPIDTKTAFLATGKHDLRGWSHRNGSQNDYIGFKMHFRLTPAQQNKLSATVCIALFPGGYVGLEPIENGIANLCLVITKRQFALWHKNWDLLLENLMLATPPLANLLSDASPCWNKPLTIFGIPYGFVFSPSADDPPALYRLGDQMAVIPSLCGDGIAIALHTGFLAANCHARGGARRYHQLAHAQLRPQIVHAARLARLLSLPTLQAFVLPLIRLAPALVARGIAATRVREVRNP